MALKITIDHNRVQESPIDASTAGRFAFSTATSSLAQDIVHGMPGVYLISGYRGSGKTSFVRGLQSEISTKYPSSEILFVYLNFAKFESHSILLRRLTREFYYQFSINEGKNPLYEKMCKLDKHRKTLKLFKNIFDRTFYDIAQTSVALKTKETIFQESFTTKLKDILILAAAILSFGVTMPAWQWTMLRDLWWVKGGLLIISGVVIIVKGWQIRKSITRSRARKKETSKSKFYDNEIAEHHLNEILQMFHNEGCKIVFVLDELDKIDDAATLNKLLHELKPIMLSGRASFLVVSGQNLYYNFHQSQGLDDHLLSSLFSKTQHVPLASPAELKELVKSYVITDLSRLNTDERKLFEGYLDHLIFKSNLILRRLNGLIRQQLVWEDRAAHLYINGSPETFDRYSRAMSVLDVFRSNVINSVGFEDPVRDYINMQLSLYVHSALSKSTADIEIVRTAEQLQTDNKLNVDVCDYCVRLRDALLSAKLIVMPKHDKSSTYGEAADQPTSLEFLTDILKQNHSSPNSEAILSSFSDFQKILMSVYGQVRNLKDHDFEKEDFVSLVRWFKAQQALDIPGLDDPVIKGVFNKPKTLFEDREIKSDALKAFKDHKLEFSLYTQQLLSYYVRYFASKKISSYQPQDVDRNIEADIVLKPNESHRADLLFDVKFRTNALSVIRDDLHRCLEVLKKYDTATGKKNHLVYVLFSDEGASGLEKIQFRFNQYAAELFGEAADQFTLISVYVGNLHTLIDSIDKLEEDLISGYTTFPDIFLENQLQPKDKPEYDDDQSQTLLDATAHDYLVRITPVALGSYWRVGLRFSANSEFPELLHRHFTDHPLIHLYRNVDSGKVMVAHYYRGNYDPHEYQTNIEHYVNQGFYFSVVYSKNMVTVHILNDQKEPVLPKPIVLYNANVFRVCAWADGKSTFRWRVSIREQRTNQPRAGVRSQPAAIARQIMLKILGANKYPLSQANIHFKNVIGSNEVYVADQEGVVKLPVVSSPHLTNVLLVAAPDYFGAVLINVDLTQDIVVELKEQPRGISQIIFTKRWSKVMLTEGEVQVGLDKEHRHFIMGRMLKINGEALKPINFSVDKPMVASYQEKIFDLIVSYADRNVVMLSMRENDTNLK